MNDFLFNPTQQQQSRTVEYYCFTDSADYHDNNKHARTHADSDKVLAKKIIRSDSSPQYYVKISNNNKLFNPLDSGLTDKSYSILDTVCKPADKFRSVNEQVFLMYINFLSSKHIAWLHKAEREMV